MFNINDSNVYVLFISVYVDVVLDERFYSNEVIRQFGLLLFALKVQGIF